MITSRFEKIVSYTILILFSLSVAIPVIFLLLTAVSPSRTGQISLLNFQWANFPNAWNQTNFGQHLLVSALVTVAVVIGVLLIAPLAAYGLGVLNLPGHRWIFVVFLIGILIPLEGVIIPLYFNLRSFGLIGNISGLVVAHIGLSMSFGIFWMRASFRAIPVSLIESARVDGANVVQVLTQVLLPVAKPAIVTLGLLTFMWTWNDYFLAFVLVNNPDLLPATVALGSFATKFTNEVNLMSAAAVMLAAPILVLYIFFQRQFIAGVLSGALKG